MKKLKQLNKQQGFTIIEVMIVLAIAALILLVVFLAVPSLQRSQRNNARKSDASRIAAAIVDFTSTNQGKLPGQVIPPPTATDCNNVRDSSATLSQFTGLTCDVRSAALPTSNSLTANTFYIETTAGNYTTLTPSGTNPNALILGEGVTCSGGSALTTTGATSTSMGLLYSLESGTNFSWGCVSPQ